MEVDLDVRRDHRGRLDVEASPAEEIESPREDVSRLVDLEGFKLCRSQSF